APEADRRDAEQSYVGPRVPVEEQLVAIWSEILGVEPIGIYDNFFQLGGHSLQATRMMSRIAETFGVELPLRSFFEAPRIADLALLITQQRSVEVEQDELAQLLSQLEGLSEDELKAFLSS
ncbi:MAG TPA: phosphopantetheine-binding protein, partial [Herpetosiphonaceae bacterium]